MLWLLDQGVPRSCIAGLKMAGHDAAHTGDIGLATAKDPIVLERAATEGRIVVTLDADFHALLADSLASRPSVVRIRDEGLKGPEVTALILELAKRFSDQLREGCALTIRNSRVRYRMLPLR